MGEFFRMAVAVLIGAISLAAAAGPARSPLAAMDDASLDELIRIHAAANEQVRLVLVPAVVTTRRGRIVRGLDAADFRLFEDHVPQKIHYFDTESREPVSVAFLLDLSGSMRQEGKLDEAKQAIRIFVESMGERDRFGLIGFADRQVTWITDLTDDRVQFLRRLEVQNAYGQTALFDAVAATPGLVDASVKGRKAIVLITDGDDNASRIDSLRSVQVARRVHVPIYVLGFSSITSGVFPRDRLDPSLSPLQRFSTETGGSLFSLRDPVELKESVLQIVEELRFQYVLGYHSTRKYWDGQFRRIQLESSRGGHLVRSRSGYYAVP